MLELFKKVTLPGLLFSSLLFAGSVLASDSPVLDRVLETRVLKVGMSGNQPPMNTKNRSGVLIGYEVDLANAMAAALGVKLEMVTMPFPGLLSALKGNKIDMIMSGMAITPERSRDVLFAGPYMMSGKSMLASAAFLANLSSAEDFNKPEIRLAALENSTSQQFVEHATPKATLVKIKDYDQGVDMVIAGTVNAMVADMPICVLSVQRFPTAGLATLKAPLSIEPFGIAVSKKDRQFASLVDNYLDTFGRMGLLEQLQKKWFEDTSWIAELP